MKKWLACMAILMATTSTAAHAQRQERLRPARVAVERTCPLTPVTAIEGERSQNFQESAFGLALANIGASFVGDLAGAGINAIADALDRASQERGYGHG